jgi:sulfopyruvate decarboxylase subunit beta
MNYVDSFRVLASWRKNEIVITSAGNSGQAWWEVTRDSKGSFYLDASMSLATMFGAGLAMAQPSLDVWAFMGDGAFCMNPGMLMVEKQLALPNLTHILVSNRSYGATSNAALPNKEGNDYCAIARGMGIQRTFFFDSLEKLKTEGPEAFCPNEPAYTFVVLEVEPFSPKEQKLEQPPFDAPELKYLVGRHIEERTGCSVFGYRL